MGQKSSYRVLVIDDEIEFLNVAAADLERLGVEVYTASNGLDGYEFIRSHPDLNLVLSDIRMPGIDGIELLRRVRFELSMPELRFYLITGFPELVKDNLEPLNPEGVIEKPVGVSAFNQILKI